MSSKLKTHILNKKKKEAVNSNEIKQMVLSSVEIFAQAEIQKEVEKIRKNIQDKVVNEINRLTRDVRKGDTGLRGLSGATGRSGSDGKSIRGDKGEKGETGLTGEPGKDILNIKPKEIVEKINTLKEAIEPKVIKGLTEEFKKYSEAIAEAGRPKVLGASGGGFTDGNFVDDETPSGTVNGTNKAFTIANKPSPTSSLKVYVNGQRMRITEDYTFSGTTITFITAPPTTSILLVDYRK